MGLILALNIFSIILTTVLVVWSGFLPGRGVQDRLAGTSLVPRE